jgi:hypothetical protein
LLALDRRGSIRSISIKSMESYETESKKVEVSPTVATCPHCPLPDARRVEIFEADETTLRDEYVTWFLVESYIQCNQCGKILYER